MNGGGVGLQGLPAPRPTGALRLSGVRSHLVMRTCVRMTSDGHAITRLQRLLDSGRGTPAQIRSLVSELPRRPDLELALAICLALLDRVQGLNSPDTGQSSSPTGFGTVSEVTRLCTSVTREPPGPLRISGEHHSRRTI